VIGSAALDLNSLAAVGVLLGAAAGAYQSIRIVGPNRRKVIEDTTTTATTRATAALDTALTRYEADNVRLRDDLDELEAKFASVVIERDELRARVNRMLAQFAADGTAPPD
jgi:hypothetical protein